MTAKEIAKLEKVVEQSRDNIELKLVVASLKCMVNGLAGAKQLQESLDQLYDELDRGLPIPTACRRCQAAITAVAVATTPLG